MEAHAKTEAAERMARKYARAPITEAIIEIRVQPAAGISGATCKKAFARVQEQFPEVKELMMVQAEITAGQIGAQTTQRMIGCAMQSKELRQVVTVMPDKFAFSQLPPYDAWEVFCPAAKKLWDLYVAELKPEKVTRIATRFINRVELPMPVKDFSVYFRTAPAVSANMPQTEIAGAFMQLQLPQKDLACSVVLNTAVLAAENDAVPFILDIDIFDESKEYAVSDVIWSRLDDFRWRKNEIFEACITDAVRELIS